MLGVAQHAVRLFAADVMLAKALALEATAQELGDADRDRATQLLLLSGKYAQLSVGYAPGFRNAYFELGRVLQAVGENGRSARAYLQFMRFEPCHPSALGNAAAVFLGLGRLERARECISRQLQINPYSFYPYLILGKVYAAEGEMDRAVEVVEQGCRRAVVGRGMLYHLLAELKLEQHDYEGAERAALQSVSYDPDNPQIYRFLACRLYLPQGREAQAVRALEDYLRLYQLGVAAERDAAERALEVLKGYYSERGPAERLGRLDSLKLR